MSGCIPLTTSTVCPMYAGFSVKTGALFQTVEEFDQVVRRRIRSEFLRSCPSFRNEGLRFEISLGCSMILSISKGDCSNPPPVCATILNPSLESMSTMAKGACSASIPAPIQNHLTDSRNAGTNCRPGYEAEVALCGYATLQEQKQYCYRNQFEDKCCESIRPNQEPPQINEFLQLPDIAIELKKDSDRYFGTSMFIFATVGSTIGSIIITTLVIFLILKMKIQQDRKPQCPPKRIPDKVASRTSFYF